MEFQPGDQFPTEQALSEEFGVTRNTVREALHWLEKGGLIQRRRGQGTFVTARPKPPADRRVTGLTEHFAELNLDTSVRVVDQGIVKPPPEVAAALGRPADEPVLRITRLRNFEKEPLAFHECFVAIEFGARVLRLEFGQTSLMNDMEAALGVTFWEDHQQVEAVAADTGIATLLDVPLGAPLLLITRHFTVDQKEPAVVFRSHYRADRYFYTVKLSQPPERRRVAGERTGGSAAARKKGLAS